MIAIGIDLGTTNCALSFADSASEPPRPLPIPQVLAPGEVGPRPLMPSFLYFPAEGQFPPGSLALSWVPGARDVVGTFARSQGATTPGRLVSSAKSWLSHAGVDRSGEISPLHDHALGGGGWVLGGSLIEAIGGEGHW